MRAEERAALLAEVLAVSWPTPKAAMIPCRPSGMVVGQACKASGRDSCRAGSFRAASRGSGAGVAVRWQCVSGSHVVAASSGLAGRAPRRLQVAHLLLCGVHVMSTERM